MEDLPCAETVLQDGGFHVVKRIFIEENGEKFGRFYKVYNKFGQIAYIDIDVDARVKNCGCDVVMRNNVCSVPPSAYLRGSAKLVEPEAIGAVVEVVSSLGSKEEIFQLTTLTHLPPAERVVECFYSSSLTSLTSVKDVKEESLPYPIFRYSDFVKHPATLHHNLVRVSQRLYAATQTQTTKEWSNAISLVDEFNKKFNTFVQKQKEMLRNDGYDYSQLIQYQENYEKIGSLTDGEMQKYLGLPVALMKLREHEMKSMNRISDILYQLEKLRELSNLFTS